jgi:hypothetical protein
MMPKRLSRISWAITIAEKREMCMARRQNGELIVKEQSANMIRA